VVEVGGRKVGFVSTEVVVLPATLRAKVLAATSDLHLDDLFIGATHTHSGLGGYWDNVLSEWIGLGAYQARIEAFLSDQLAAALRQADHGLQPARLATGRVELPRYMYNRTDRRNPVDDLLTAVRVATPEGKPIASVVVFGVHATFLSWHDMRLSGDWPGSLMRELELGGAPALFFQGAGGDSTWTDIPDQKPGLERWIRFGQAIAEDTRAALAPAQDSPPEITLDLARVRVPLPKTDVGGAVPWPFNRAASNVFSWFAGAGTTNVSYLRLGPVTFANVPSEVVASVGIPWRKSLGDATLVTLMDDYVGYVERPEFITGHAGEAQRSYFGPTLAAELLKGLELARKQALSPTP